MQPSCGFSPVANMRLGDASCCCSTGVFSWASWCGSLSAWASTAAAVRRGQVQAGGFGSAARTKGQCPGSSSRSPETCDARSVAMAYSLSERPNLPSYSRQS